MVAQTVEDLPAVQDTQVQSLDGEDPLEKEMATHSSILAWRIPMDRGTWRATVHGVTELDMTEVTYTQEGFPVRLLGESLSGALPAP